MKSEHVFIGLLKEVTWSKVSYLLPLIKIKRELKKRRTQANKTLLDETLLSPAERNLIQLIKQKTTQLNLNNVTRTQAYYEYYRQHPEIHWALLGHMVSRNGGWNMTDLRGELLTRLLTHKEQEDFFTFLERGNWLIFQDVYPQFLLYEQSLRQQRNLFHLLPYFHISIFMEVMWNHFWTDRDPYLLAIALVINEQSYLEQRVVQNSTYQETVLNKLPFKVQELLSLNQIIFPYDTCNENNTQLCGLTLHYFSSLHERIMLGKRLYNLLFEQTEVLEKVVRWAEQNPHTGSRKDYFPNLFNDVNESVPGKAYKQRTEGCRLKQGAQRLYSPTLTQAWKNVNHDDDEVGDWYNNSNVIYYLMHLKKNVEGEIYEAYCDTLEKIELAIIAKEAFS